MKESEIAKTLEDAGFVLQPKRGIAIDAGRPTLRYSRERIRGSFYATDNYLSATGPYVRLRDKTPPTREDRKGYPVWQGDQLAAVLTAVIAAYADADEKPASSTEGEPAAATVGAVEVPAAVEPATTAPSGTGSVSGMESETETGTEAQPEVIAASEVASKVTPETATDEKTEAATAVQASDNSAAATEPVTESPHSDSGGLFSFYTSFWRMVGAWFGGTKPKD